MYTHRVANNLSHLTCMFLVEVKQDNALPPYSKLSCSHPGALYMVYLVPHFCTFFLLSSLFKMSPKCSAKVPGWEDPQRRAWQPTQVSLPGESHEQRSLWAAVHGLQRVRHN